MINVKKRVFRELLLWELLALDLGGIPEGRNLFEVYQDQLDLIRTTTDFDFEEGGVHQFSDLLSNFDEDMPDEEVNAFKLKTRSDLKFNKDLRNQIDRKYQKTQDSDEKKLLELEMARLEQKMMQATEILNQLKKKNEAESFEIVQNAEIEEENTQEEGQNEIQNVTTLANLAFNLTDNRIRKELKSIWQDLIFWNQVQEHFEMIIRFKTSLDIVIQMKSHRWRIERMSSIDRNVLRFATYELYFQTETPVKVVINEAIEIAKKYGSADSSKFINGILDQIAICLNRKPVKTEFKKGR
jgi:transcription antitermination factor NusB